MVVFNEGRHSGEFILSEAEGHRSRDAIVVAATAGILAAGTVVGKVTATGKFVTSSVVAVDGSEVAAAVIIEGVDATSADVSVAAVTRDAEINSHILTYHADRNLQSEKDAANVNLAALGIIVR